MATRLRKPQKTILLISWSSAYDVHRLTWGWFARSGVTIQSTWITFMMLLGNGTIFWGSSWRYHSPDVCEGCVINESWESKASVFGRKTNSATIKGNAGSACLKMFPHLQRFVKSDAKLYANMFVGSVGIPSLYGFMQRFSVLMQCERSSRHLRTGLGKLIHRCIVILSQMILHRYTEMNNWNLKGIDHFAS